MEWNVYYHDINAQKIIQWNIFKHGSFYKEVDDLLKSELDKEEFIERLRKSLMYYFWSKCEYEILVSPWVGRAGDIKIDIYDQIMMNFDRFVDYVWSFKKFSLKDEVFVDKNGKPTDLEIGRKIAGIDLGNGCITLSDKEE